MRQVQFSHPGYLVTVYGGGLALEVKRLTDGASAFLQGDDAGLAYDEYCDLMRDYGKPGTNASRFTESELLDTMFGDYLDSGSAAA